MIENNKMRCNDLKVKSIVYSFLNYMMCGHISIIRLVYNITEDQ